MSSFTAEMSTWMVLAAAATGKGEITGPSDPWTTYPGAPITFHRPPVSVTLPMDLQSPRRARALLRRGACTHHDQDVVDRAELLVSELVTNALVHGIPPVRIDVGCDGEGALAVTVSDASPTVPVLRHALDRDEGGRGMGLVDVLSSAWGVHEAHDGKTVWFRLLPEAALPGEVAADRWADPGPS